MALGSHAFMLVFDAQKFTDGANLSRKELSYLKNAMQEIRAPTQSWSDQIDAATALLDKQAIGVEEYRELWAKANATLPENIAAQKLLTTELSKADSAIQSLMTAEQKQAQAVEQHNAAIAASAQLLKTRIQTEEQHADALARLAAGSPAVLAAAREKNELDQMAQGILRSLQTEEQKYAEKRANSYAAMRAGGITEKEHLAYLDQERQKLPAVIAEEQKRNAMLERLKAITREVMTTEEKRIAAIRELDSVMQHTNMTQEAYRRKLQQINETHIVSPFSAGYTEKITATHAPVNVLRNDITQLAASQLYGVPIAGQFSGAIAALGPVALVVAAAVIGVKLAVDAFQFASAKVSEQADAIDKLNAEARNLGESVPVLQAFRSAAHEIGNVETDQADKGLEKLGVNIAKAADGSKEAAKAFDKLVLSAKDMKNQSLVTSFGQIGDAIRNSALPYTEKLQVAQALLGKGGVHLVSTMMEGSAAIDHHSERLKELGLQVTDVAAISVDNMKDAWEDVGKITDGFWNQVTVQVTPALEAMAHVIQQTVVDTGLLQSTFALIPPTIEVFMAGISATQVLIGGAAVSAARLAELLSVAAKIASNMPGTGLHIDPAQFAALDSLIAKTKEAGQVSIGSGVTGQIGAEYEKAKLKAGEELSRLQVQQIAIRRGGGTDKDSDGDDPTKQAIKRADELVKSLKAETETFGQAGKAADIFKLASEGVSKTTLDELSALNAKHEAQKAGEIATKKLSDGEKQRADSIKHTVDQLKEQEIKLRGGERALVDYRLEQLKADPATRAAAVASVDAADKLEAEKKSRENLVKANEKAADVAADLRRKLSGAPDSKIPDLIKAGASKEEIERVRLLEQETQWREKILALQKGSVDAVKAGSKEHFEGVARARAQFEMEQQRRIALANPQVVNPRPATAKGQYPVTAAKGGDDNVNWDAWSRGETGVAYNSPWRQSTGKPKPGDMNWDAWARGDIGVAGQGLPALKATAPPIISVAANAERAESILRDIAESTEKMASAPVIVIEHREVTL